MGSILNLVDVIVKMGEIELRENTKNQSVELLKNKTICLILCLEVTNVCNC